MKFSKDNNCLIDVRGVSCKKHVALLGLQRITNIYKNLVELNLKRYNEYVNLTIRYFQRKGERF